MRGDDQDRPGVEVEVRRGAPTDDEVAALVAVVTEAYATESAEAVADEKPARSAWALSRSSLRAPLERDLGWRGFGG